MREGYSVTVSKFGESILTIEPAMLSGQSDLTVEDEEAIRDAGEHLRSFIGDERLALVHEENQRVHTALFNAREQLREAERRASAAEDGLRGLVRFAASVWYDEGNCSAEEEEAMHAARVALSKL